MKYLRIIISLLMVMSIHSVLADIKIVSFTNLQETQRRVMDDEGEFCALVKFKTNDQGFLAEALQMRKNMHTKREQTVYMVEAQCESHPDEVWVYMSSKTKRFRLYHPTYGGLKESGEEVRNGLYYPPYDLYPEMVYQLEIQCEKAELATAPITPNLPALVEMEISRDDDAIIMSLNKSLVKVPGKYLVPAGNHVFRARRLFYQSQKQQVEAVPGKPIQLTASLQHIPVNVFGGIEVGKPSSYSNLSYGFRAGIICHLGIYVSYLTTLSGKADGDPVNYNRLPYEPINLYSDPLLQYQHFSAGLIAQCFSGLHVYAGMGKATRTVTWQGIDGKRHESENDYYSGTSWEAGLMYNVNKFYLLAGTDCLNGSYGGRVGFGVYLNVLK